jgi:RNA polymerase sigma factor (sigma-70 family)
MVDGDGVRRITELYKARSSVLVGYALVFMGGDRLTSEDLVNDAFHALYLQWAKVSERDDQALYAWLRRVIRNKAVSAYRHLSRMVVYDPQDPLTPLNGPAVDADPAHKVLAAELLDRCAAVIQDLPMRLRVAILLRAEGHSSSVVAGQMGVTAATVRGYWSQALEELRYKVGDVIEILDAMEGPDKEDSA